LLFFKAKSGGPKTYVLDPANPEHSDIFSSTVGQSNYAHSKQNSALSAWQAQVQRIPVHYFYIAAYCS
jgi:hypothetical protein